MKVCYLSIVLIVAIFTSSASFAQQTDTERDPVGHSGEVTKKKPRLGPHNGTLKNVAGVQVETVVSTAGLRIYLSSVNGRPLAVKQSRGIAKLSLQGVAKRYRYDLFPAGDHSLKIDIDLSRFSGRQVSVDCQLVGVSAKTISYSEVSVVPLDEAQVRANPNKYPAMADSIGEESSTVAVKSEQVRPGVFKTIAADQKFIKQQKTCPVMDEPLDAMGGPYRVNAAGKAIYICCPGCAKRIAADPEKYLAKLDSLGVQAPQIN